MKFGFSKPTVRRPSPALVISVIAVIIAVGGGTFALAASDNKKDKKIANKVVTKRAPSLAVASAKTADTATNATNANNANTVGGHPVGYAHITFSGTTPQVDTSQSTAGVTVAQSNPFVASTSCVSAPFTVKNATANVDFIADPGNNEIVELTPVVDTGHRCPIGTIEVDTHNANANTAVTLPYYISFSG